MTPANKHPQSATRYWQRVRILTLALLTVWFAVSFGIVFWARELSGLSLGGWPLHFYLAAQGVALIYLAIIGLYAFAMRRLDALAAVEADHGA